MKILRILLVSLSCCIACNPHIYADDTTTLPIVLEETRPKPVIPTKPQSPSRLQLQAYYNGVAIVITSTIVLQADILIYDNLSGMVYYDGAAMLASSFSCNIPADASAVTIIVTTTSNQYQGVLYK